MERIDRVTPGFSDRIIAEPASRSVSPSGAHRQSSIQIGSLLPFSVILAQAGDCWLRPRALPGSGVGREPIMFAGVLLMKRSIAGLCLVSLLVLATGVVADPVSDAIGKPGRIAADLDRDARSRPDVTLPLLQL